MRFESGSSLGVFRTCPKKYEFQIEKKLSPSGYSSSLGYGNFCHGFAAINRAGDLGPDAVRTAMEDLAHFKEEMMTHHGDQAEQIEADFLLAEAVTDMHRRYWRLSESNLADTQFENLDVEAEWEFKVSDTQAHVGKRDGYLLHKEWKKHFLYEMKTALSKDESGYLYRLNLDHQINSNLLALHHEGKIVSGVLYDIIWKPGLRRKTGRKTMPDETLAELNERILQEYRDKPGELFQRVLVTRTNDHLVDYTLELKQQMDDLEQQKIRYRNPGACMNFGKACPYFDLCLDPNAQEIEKTFIKREKRLPELKRGG